MPGSPKKSMHASGPLIFATLAVLVLFSFFGCSGSTEARLVVDLLSYLSPSERVVEIWLPPFNPLTVYVFPGIQIDSDQTGPDDARKEGLWVGLPPISDLPPLADISIRFVGSIAIRNTDPSVPIQLVSLSVFAAPSGTDDIYSGDTKVASAPIDSIAPGETSFATVILEVHEGSPIEDILDSEAFMIGMSVYFPASTGKKQRAVIELTGLQLSVSGHPFLLIP